MFNQTIIHADCIERLKGISDNSIDLILTDPPYGINFQSNYRTVKFDKIINDDNLDWIEPVIKECYRVLKDNTVFYCFTRWDVYPIWFNIISKYFKIKNCLIIKRKHTSMGDLLGSFAFSYEMCIFAMKGRKEYNKLNLIKTKRIDKRSLNKSGQRYRFPDLIDFIDANEWNMNMEHPTQKSVDIYSFFIELHTNEGDTVLDMYCGSGTAAVACKILNRKSICIEIDKTYYEIAKKRLSKIPVKLTNFTGGDKMAEENESTEETTEEPTEDKPKETSEESE